jgi:hypothetical protein
MKNLFKTLIQKLQGIDSTIGETIDLTYGGGARVRSTVNPDQELGYNEFWERIYAMNKANVLGKE